MKKDFTYSNKKNEKLAVVIPMMLFFLCFNTLQAQVGIGTNLPHASSMLEVQASDKGFLLPRLTSSQRTAIPSPATGLQVYDNTTNSIWYFNGSYWVNTQAMATVGDVKSGMQTIDHSGWIKLDGRAVNALTANQQAAAIALGFTTNLPDASSAYLVQNGSAMGAVSGANSTTLTQANLPNVNFTGSAASAGSHSHKVDPAQVNTNTTGDHTHSGSVGGGNDLGGGSAIARGFTAGGFLFSVPTLTINSAGNHSHTVDIPATTSSTDGAHTHTVTVSSGGSATPINIAPRSLSVNMFIYLGQ